MVDLVDPTNGELIATGRDVLIYGKLTVKTRAYRRQPESFPSGVIGVLLTESGEVFCGNFLDDLPNQTARIGDGTHLFAHAVFTSRC